jgi:hypothetical protein
VAIAVIAVLTLGGLWGISRNAPSAAQFDSVAMITEGVSPETGCANFAGFWMRDSGLHVSTEAIEDLTNCRMATDGTWFVPASANDPRIREGQRLTEAEELTVAVLSAQLADDLIALERNLPRSLRESVKANFEPENLPVFGHTARGRSDLSPKRARYVRVAQAFLMSPQRTVVADYVGWLMERRANAVDTFETMCFADPDEQFLIRACKGLREEFGTRYIPMYWDLNDPILIQEYLVDRARSGESLPAVLPAATDQRMTTQHG